MLQNKSANIRVIKERGKKTKRKKMLAVVGVCQSSRKVVSPCVGVGPVVRLTVSRRQQCVPVSVSGRRLIGARRCSRGGARVAEERVFQVKDIHRLAGRTRDI